MRSLMGSFSLAKLPHLIDPNFTRVNFPTLGLDS